MLLTWTRYVVVGRSEFIGRPFRRTYIPAINRRT